MNEKLKVGSLFSGIGGIELGLERAGGFETAWFCDCEPYAVAVLKQHWPRTPIYGDVTTINFANVPPIDVLTGGFPCQDISNAGKRAGIEGSRSGLWAYCVEAIRGCRPRVAYFENVSALTQRGLDAVLCDLAALGYDAEWYCIPAKSVGAPHQRDRICILCYPNNYGQSSTKERKSIVEGSDSSKERKKQTCELERPSEQYAELAYSDSEGLQRRTEARNVESGRENTNEQFGGYGNTQADVANTNNERPFRRRKQYKSKVLEEDGREMQKKRNKQTLSFKSGGKRTSWATTTQERGHWSVEPNVGRVVNGLPCRVDRIKCLGNAVVPQWAQAIAEAIKEKMNTGGICGK